MTSFDHETTISSSNEYYVAFIKLDGGPSTDITEYLSESRNDIGCKLLNDTTLLRHPINSWCMSFRIDFSHIGYCIDNDGIWGYIPANDPSHLTALLVWCDYIRDKIVNTTPPIQTCIGVARGDFCKSGNTVHCTVSGSGCAEARKLAGRCTNCTKQICLVIYRATLEEAKGLGSIKLPGYFLVI